MFRQVNVQSYKIDYNTLGLRLSQNDEALKEQSIFIIHNHSPRKSSLVIIWHINGWPTTQVGKAGIGLQIAHNQYYMGFMKSYLVICPE